mmetsp:Transcript_2472/g.6171  ORF Transcript_2472/g.6171 Transcript_2472/m.6171 type:complete len:216 (-) Transcript_2472:23-670(-)
MYASAMIMALTALFVALGPIPPSVTLPLFCSAFASSPAIAPVFVSLATEKFTSFSCAGGSTGFARKLYEILVRSSPSCSCLLTTFLTDAATTSFVPFCCRYLDDKANVLTALCTAFGPLAASSTCPCASIVFTVAPASFPTFTSEVTVSTLMSPASSAMVRLPTCQIESLKVGSLYGGNLIQPNCAAGLLLRRHLRTKQLEPRPHGSITWKVQLL